MTCRQTKRIGFCEGDFKSKDDATEIGYGIIFTGVPTGRVSNNSSMSLLRRATQPRVQSPLMPPPWMKISPLNRVESGGRVFFSFACMILRYSVLEITP